MSAADAVPQVYVACLASYANGVLHGRWVDASMGEQHIRDAIDSLLEDSFVEVAEEWAIHDYSGFGGVALGEHPSLDEVAALADMIVTNGELAIELYKHKCHVDEAKVALEEHYEGEYSSLEHWAIEHLEGRGWLQGVPGDLQPYIDFEAWGRDAELSGVIYQVLVNGSSHVFTNY